MRRLRDMVSQPCRPGGRGLPSAATTSGCHRLAGRGWEAGGEIRRRSTETGESISGNLCPARKHGPRSLKIAADGAPEGVSAAAVRLRMANTSRHNYQGAPLGAPSPLIRERGGNQKLTLRFGAGMHGRGCLTCESGNRCEIAAARIAQLTRGAASSSPSSLRRQGPIRRVAHDCGQRS
jgi:hypothetical protein